MIDRPDQVPFTWRRAPLSLLLLALMLLWLASPILSLHAGVQLGPESDQDPTPEQSRALRIVHWTTVSYGLIAPMVVLTVAWWTRRRAVLVLALVAIGLAALGLGVVALLTTD
ncbi:hypothetical protein Daura_33060 [Dactylosporangium aurantiacum]|uniref:Uncharacterized protein n=1 Tax=Dactylosporangium aurantiacum TaxID=35754 RepID=A0A9Q9IFE5_9ACTN|nr:hypothetical protein [Dactylosporangium aurantiacum]MDG6105023.1 hypothetical protein [Dactylosporangium aurantiacum]UWZ51555.1 hypothetical protein Daura_33060 [Dactylosporangium aurantiacum]